MALGGLNSVLFRTFKSCYVICSRTKPRRNNVSPDNLKDTSVTYAIGRARTGNLASYHRQQGTSPDLKETLKFPGNIPEQEGNKPVYLGVLQSVTMLKNRDFGLTEDDGNDKIEVSKGIDPLNE